MILGALVALGPLRILGDLGALITRDQWKLWETWLGPWGGRRILGLLKALGAALEALGLL